MKEELETVRELLGIPDGKENGETGRDIDRPSVDNECADSGENECETAGDEKGVRGCGGGITARTLVGDTSEIFEFVVMGDKNEEAPETAENPAGRLVGARVFEEFDEDGVELVGVVVVVVAVVVFVASDDIILFGIFTIDEWDVEYGLIIPQGKGEWFGDSNGEDAGDVHGVRGQNNGDTSKGWCVRVFKRVIEEGTEALDDEYLGVVVAEGNEDSSLTEDARVRTRTIGDLFDDEFNWLVSEIGVIKDADFGNLVSGNSFRVRGWSWFWVSSKLSFSNSFVFFSKEFKSTNLISCVE
jgi:hypothetical protein